MTGSIKSAFDNAFPAAPVGGDVEKSLARQAGAIVEQRMGSVETGQNSGSMLFATRAALYARTGTLAILPAKAEVRADPTPAYNGLYANSTGGTGSAAWPKIAELPDELIRAVDSGAGTANAIKVTVSRLPTDGAVVSFAAFQANTAEDVTVEVVGGSTYAIRTAGGAKPSSGAITAGMVLLGRVDASSSTFRLATDTTSTAIQAASEAARDLAKDYANKAEDATVDADGNHSSFHFMKKTEVLRDQALAADAASGAAAARDAAVAARNVTTDARDTAIAAMNTAIPASETATTAAAVATSAANNAQSKTRTCALWTTLATLTPTTVGQGAEVLDSDSGTHTDPSTSATVANAGSYTAYATTIGAWTRIGGTGLSAKLDKTVFDSRVPSVETRQSEIVTALKNGFSAFLDQTSTGVWAVAGGFADFAMGIDGGVDIAAGILLDNIGADLIAGPDTATVRCRIYRRPTSSENINLAPPQSDDTLIDTISGTPAAFGLTVGASAIARASIPLTDAIRVATGITYIARIDMLDSLGNLLAMGLGYAAGTDSRQRRHGWYHANVSTSSWSNGDTSKFQSIFFRHALLASVPTIAASVDANTRSIGDIQGSFTKVSSPAGQRPSTGMYGGSRGGFAVGMIAGTDVPVGTSLRRILATIAAGSGATKVICKISSRASGSTATPGQVSDTLLDTITLSLASAGLTDGGASTVVTFPLTTPILTTAGTVYLLEFAAWDDAGTRMVVDIAQSTAITGLGQVQKGWYISNTSLSSYTQITNSTAVAWRVDADAFQAISAPSDSAKDVVTTCAATAAGLVVTIPNSSVLTRRGANALAFGGVLTLAATTTGSVSAEAVTINNASYPIYSGTAHLAHANVSSVVVKDAGSGVTLALTTDYLLNAEHGALVKVASGSQAVLVDYAWAARRYDLVYLDPETLTLGVVQGTERVRDAAEFIPALGDPKRIALFHARVVGSTIELIPVWRVWAGEKTSLALELVEGRRRAKRGLRKSRGKLVRGSAFTIAVYGDSQCAIQSQSPSATVPNGPYRDRGATYLADAIGSDVISALPLYTSTTLFGNDDGAGQVHTKLGFHWTFKGELETAFGYADNGIGLLNFGIGGTSSASTTNNGLDSSRLTALTSSASHLVLVMFGQNELGVSTTEANIVSIVQAILTAGKEAIVIGVPRCNADRGVTTATWLLTNRALRRAAEYCGVPFLDTNALYADEHIESIGISPHDICSANLTNHPGIREHSLFGQALAAMLLDE